MLPYLQREKTRDSDSSANTGKSTEKRPSGHPGATPTNVGAVDRNSNSSSSSKAGEGGKQAQQELELKLELELEQEQEEPQEQHKYFGFVRPNPFTDSLPPSDAAFKAFPKLTGNLELQATVGITQRHRMTLQIPRHGPTGILSNRGSWWGATPPPKRGPRLLPSVLPGSVACYYLIRADVRNSDDITTFQGF